MKIIINADDFGMNDGVNAAVERAFRRGCLNSASLMPFAQSAAAAFKIARDNPGLAVGLHADFDRGFIMMMIDWIFRREKFKKWIEQKLRAQIQECARHGVKHLSHLDSHRNVHMIPAVFSVFKNLAAEYKIPRVRVVNENFFLVIFDNPGFDWIKTGAWMKWPILTVLRWMSGRAAQSDTYFYGLTYSGKLFGRNAQKIRVPSYYNSVEVSSHPSAFLDASGGKHAIDYIFHSSPDRTREFETLMNKKFLKNIIF